MSLVLHLFSGTRSNYLRIYNIAKSLRLLPATLCVLSNTLRVSGTRENIDKFRDIMKDDLGVAIFGDSIPLHYNILEKEVSQEPDILPRKFFDRETPIYYTPIQVAEIYKFPKPINDQRVNIAIIELGGGYREQDLATYFQYLGLTTIPNVVAISVDGARNSPGDAADVEVVLDIEIIGAIVPNSNIYVYFAPNSSRGFYNAIRAAIYDTTRQPSVISISWGAPEPHWTQQQLQAYNDLFKEASVRGINVCAASGDDGATDGVSNKKFNVDFPSSSPYVIACGGTTLRCPTRKYSDITTSEIVWGTTYETQEGGGGGYSTVFSPPPYQETLGLTKRGVPDVCGVADPKTGWLIYYNAKYSVIGGTSAVSPMWSAYLAIVRPNKFVAPLLYNNPGAFHDIVVGNNHGYNADKGWDPTTGLGSPNGDVLNSIFQQR